MTGLEGQITAQTATRFVENVAQMLGLKAGGEFVGGWGALGRSFCFEFFFWCLGSKETGFVWIKTTRRVFEKRTKACARNETKEPDRKDQSAKGSTVSTSWALSYAKVDLAEAVSEKLQDLEQSEWQEAQSAGEGYEEVGGLGEVGRFF